MMKRNSLLALLLMLCLTLPVQPAFAVDIPDVQPLPAVQVAPEFADELQRAMDALAAHTPGAVVDYAVRERDDGRYEWDLFFTLNGQLGQGEIDAETFQVRRVRLYDMSAGSMSAAQVMDILVQAKGELVLMDLELDMDDGRLRYEGEAVQGNKRFEFEMSLTGNLIEWERD